MNGWLKALTVVWLVLSGSFIYWKLCFDLRTPPKATSLVPTSAAPHLPTPETPKGPGIFFVETTDRLVPPTLVACSIESAARTYPDKPVYFFMKGLNPKLSIDFNSIYKTLLLLASMHNVHILPLSFEELFKGTPLDAWYQKVDPSKQRFWIHHVSDACRQALTWKYGGIYMDTDVISLKPVPEVDFLVAESPTLCSSAVLGFNQHHPFLWDCMEDYVNKYNGNIWGQQGPLLYTRMAATLCEMPNFARVGDAMCQNFSYLQPDRFYPIPWSSWKKYFEKWDNTNSMFQKSYGLHFWNYMNTEHREVTAGSETVAEHIFMEYCPVTYYSLVKRHLN